MNQLFFTPNVAGGLAQLDEEESRHLLTVLRRKLGDTLDLTDGKGHFYTAEIAETGKRHAVLRILDTRPAPARAARLHLAVAPTKQADRLEWLLEKAVEIGVETFTPIRCQRSERDTLRIDRLEKIAISALKQSLHGHLTQINPLTPLRQVIQNATEPTRCLAWCADTPLPHLASVFPTPAQDALVLIGPEGDFSPEEVEWATQNGFTGVSLGTARLRTETAGLLATAAFALHLEV
jgi:16S rRNA (uracil1498-N3)-methyltransferase